MEGNEKTSEFGALNQEVNDLRPLAARIRDATTPTYIFIYIHTQIVSYILYIYILICR